MMLATATTPPACYATVPAFYAARSPKFHTMVVVDGDYAYASYYDEHVGGEGAFRRKGGRWCKLVSGGGAMSVKDLVAFGVPQPVAERLFTKMRRKRAM